MNILTKLARALAQVIDLIVGFALLILALRYIQPALTGLSVNEYLAAGLALVAFAAALLLIQLPFLQNAQTIGKAFFGLKVESTQADRPLTLAILITRELVKLFSLFIICLPVLWSDLGGHDVAMRTRVCRPAREVKA